MLNQKASCGHEVSEHHLALDGRCVACVAGSEMRGGAGGKNRAQQRALHPPRDGYTATKSSPPRRVLFTATERRIILQPLAGEEEPTA